MVSRNSCEKPFLNSMSVCVFVSMEILCSHEAHFRGVLLWVSTHICWPDSTLVKNGQKNGRLTYNTKYVFGPDRLFTWLVAYLRYQNKGLGRKINNINMAPHSFGLFYCDVIMYSCSLCIDPSHSDAASFLSYYSLLAEY